MLLRQGPADLPREHFRGQRGLRREAFQGLADYPLHIVEVGLHLQGIVHPVVPFPEQLLVRYRGVVPIMHLPD